ncbi:MAG: hypothetical protein M3Y91_00380 [Actinomycetota bacterium]|nr:hypothetical protein [Actinomycetota bacterium]
MTKVWYCSTCGYEVEFRGRCHQCGQRLEQSPMPELEPGAEEDELGYRLDDWADDARGRMIVELIDATIAHRFEDDELVVDVGDEEQVDLLVARLTVAGSADEYVVDDSDSDHDAAASVLDDEQTEWGRPTTEVVQLEAAATRLSLDPTDMEADGEVAEASTAVFMADDPPWADADTWAAVGRVTRRLMAALGSDDALEEEIRTQAGILARLLRPIVRPGAGGEPSPGSGSDGGPSTASDLELAASSEAGTDSGAPATLGAGTDSGAPATLGAGTDGGGTRGADPVPDPADGIAPGDRVGADAGATNEAIGEEGAASGPGGSVVSGKRTETVYELGEWLPEQRAELAMLLDQGGITHSWDTENLVVASDREADVETVLDRIEAVDDPDADEEATYRALEELFAATDRLVGAPADSSRGKEVVRAVVVADGPTPVGLDDAQWWQIRQRARILADSIEHRAQTDVVLGEARTLRDLLRDLV